MNGLFFIKLNSPELIEWLQNTGCRDNRSEISLKNIEEYIAFYNDMSFDTISENHIGIAHKLYIDCGKDEDRFKTLVIEFINKQ